MDKSILRKWLNAGFVEGNVFHPMEEGTPQGGSISPTLANLALDGLEECVREAAPKRRPKTAPRSKVHIIRFADDLLATSRTREMLEDQIIPAITAFLKDRGLNLSVEKSRVVHINDGFEFLGSQVRKYGGKLLMKPIRANVIAFVRDIKEYIRNRRDLRPEHLIHQLNRRLRGWANAFRHLVSSRSFRHIDNCVFNQLWRWARRRHRKKGSRWIQRRYFQIQEGSRWAFHARYRTKGDQAHLAVLFRMSSLGIRRHVKIQSKARVFDPAYDGCFEQRRIHQRNARQRDYYRWLDFKSLEWA